MSISVRSTRLSIVLGLLAIAAAALAVPTFARSNGTITVVSPKPGSTIAGSKVVLQIKTAGFNVTDQGTQIRLNEGHFHVTLDKRPFVAIYGSTFRFRGVTAGSHTLSIQPVNTAHMPAKGYKTIDVKFATTG